jgi:uncharacterized protein
MRHLADSVAELVRPEAFGHPAREPRLIETHISWVVLAGKYAYKLRKPVNFGFLDFSTPEQRRADCEAELRLNRRLCADVYLGIVDVVERDGKLFFGGPGEVVEPAVQMRRLPESGMLAALIEHGTADALLMNHIASDLARFHAQAATGSSVDEYASPAAIADNWDENFAQTADFDEWILPSATRDVVTHYVQAFQKENAELLEQRMQRGRIREGHGDLHAGSVCVARRRVYLFDCIEFNARFRCCDVASEVAFLAMDLDHMGRADLSHAFVEAYIRHSGDEQILKLVDFYKCYRAFVRGKVLGLRLAQRGVAAQDAQRLRSLARAYFELASAYACPQSEPVLLVMMGMPATGKSTLARDVAARRGMVHLSSDIVRKQLARVRPTAHRLDAFERGLYSRAMTRRTYATLKRKATRWLRRGTSVVLDATFGQPAERSWLRGLARKSGARLIVAVCRADEAEIQRRLAARESDVSGSSDARLELWPALRAAFVEPVDLPDAVAVDTARSVDECIEEVIAWLDSRAASATRAA